MLCIEDKERHTTMKSMQPIKPRTQVRMDTETRAHTPKNAYDRSESRRIEQNWRDLLRDETGKDEQ
jgi:hypothetical protein